MTIPLLSFADEREWREHIVSDILLEVGKAEKSGRKAFHISLAGGTTPEPVYRALAEDSRIGTMSARIQVHFWVGDERVVPADSPWRNGRMIAETFGPAAATRGWVRPPVVHLWPEKDPSGACQTYAEELKAAMGRQPVFDLSILGIGADGHTAGLFTLADAMNADAPLAFSTVAPSEPSERMTLSAGVLRQSRRIMVVARGAGKKPILDAVLLGKHAYPISFVLGGNSVIYFME